MTVVLVNGKLLVSQCLIDVGTSKFFHIYGLYLKGWYIIGFFLENLGFIQQ